ncbi:MAG: Cytochrome c1 [Candidatus Tokpelaia hoelldobleri]|uniref:Cytochrome c1 n=1 Tax=Candidatus Tokpelaia hoelldobleri TaxID=1902579 RepID=A0A1U9JVK8_9HYPH|nr:MAG: Cytochrome c1 [Candidatus Tokpelaia hoelldoblerii]
MIRQLLYALLMTGGAAMAQADDLPDTALKQPEAQAWSFSGVSGTYDKAQLQRGFQVYKDVCAACHGLKFVAFRDLRKIGYTPEQIKAIAAEYEVEGEPDGEGEVHKRPARPGDYFPAPYANDEAAAFANNGSVPADLSLMARAREAGADYIHALLTGYKPPPAGMEIGENNWYNPYFAFGEAIAMAEPLADRMVDYGDGSPQTVEQYARDVSAFLTWTADPHMERRKKTGLRVMVFLLLFAGLAYCTKRQIWADKTGQEPK